MSFLSNFFAKSSGAHQWRGVIEEYRDRLPVTDKTPIVSLCEGGTPLIYGCYLSELLDGEVWLKFEGANPTGSFKDRGMTMAISKAAEAGAKAVICASTGNTSASAAAYAAKAGMRPVVLVPEGKIALGKLAQAIAHGAQLLQVDGNFDDCLRIARELSESYPVALVNSVNPYRIDGQKTAAFEVVDALGFAPDIHALPVGNAGNITAYWVGYNEYRKDGLAKTLPAMWGFQAAGSAPIVKGRVITKPETIATAIRIGNPASWSQALAARDQSGGVIDSVTDKEILDAYRLVAAKEGVFVEPSSAAGIAGLIKLKQQGKLASGKKIVITVTGNGLKDVQWVLDSASSSKIIPPAIRATLHDAAEAIGLEPVSKKAKKVATRSKSKKSVAKKKSRGK
jgi:threonine synthase